MTKKEIAHAAVDALKAEYPDAKCSLDYKTPLQLLIATRLSAQCTDARVNLVTPALFERFPDAESFAQAEVSEVAEYIKSCGLFKTTSFGVLHSCGEDTSFIFYITGKGSINFFSRSLFLNLAAIEHEILLGNILGESVVCHLGTGAHLAVVYDFGLNEYKHSLHLLHAAAYFNP